MKMNCRKRKKKNKLTIFLWILFLVFVSSFFLLQLISRKINPIILRYATVEANRFTKALINSAIGEDVVNEIGDNLFTISKNSDGEIQTVDFNAKEVNRLLNLVSEKIEKKLLKMEEGKVDDLNVSNALKGYNFDKLKKGIVCEIPVGILFGNSLFSNLGPVIPIKLSFLGQVTTHLNTKVESYGINNAYLELYIHIEVVERIIMPMMTEEQNVKLDVPLTMKIIQGKVPTYYQGGLEKKSSLLTLPIEK